MNTFQNIYIHYGQDHFDLSYFTPVRNGSFKPKPADGTGLWATQEGDVYENGRMIYSWKNFCEDNHFQMKSLKHFFRFRLAEGANVLILEEEEDLVPLPKTRPWEVKTIPWKMEELENRFVTGESIPSIKQLEKLYAPNWCYLDYEKLASEGVDGTPVDAIELRHSHLFTDSLATWDCDCIVVMNPGVVEVL